MGHREDGSLQQDQYPNINAPVDFLDNQFHDPDLDRFLTAVDRYRPDIAVIGDAFSAADAERIQAAVDQISYTDMTCIAVPKCRDAFEILGEDVVLGYPNGYSTLHPDEYSDLGDWRGRDIHVLGGSPHAQLEVIDLLTQPTLDGQLPANILGVDGNGVLKAAYFGEYWTPSGYARADQLSIRETVDRSLSEMKGFWQSHGVWPDTPPIEEYGPAVLEPDEPVYVENGGDIRTENDLWNSYIGEYEDGTYAFSSEAGKKFVEYRDGLL